MLHNSANILGRRLSSTRIVEGVRLVNQEIKGNARRYLEVIKKGVVPVLTARVVVEGIAVEITEVRGIPFYGETLKWRCNVDFHEGGISKCDKTLKMVHKEYDVSIVNIFTY